MAVVVVLGSIAYPATRGAADAGMSMTAGMSMDAMRDMAAVDPDEVDAKATADARGDQPLAGRLVDGVTESLLTASVARWNILPEVEVLAHACNEQVAGPRLTLAQGDRVRIRVTDVVVQLQGWTVRDAYTFPVMHIQGGPFVATDANPVPPEARLTKDTVNVVLGEGYAVPGPTLVDLPPLERNPRRDERRRRPRLVGRCAGGVPSERHRRTRARRQWRG